MQSVFLCKRKTKVTLGEYHYIVYKKYYEFIIFKEFTILYFSVSSPRTKAYLARFTYNAIYFLY